MALAYKSPGVYVEEIDRGTKPIEAVGTSTAAFIGITAEASYKKLDAETGNLIPDPDQEPRMNKATLVTNWTEFTKIFGGFLPKEASYLPDAVYSYFDNGGGPCYIVSLRAVNEPQPEAKPSRRSRAAAAAASGETPAEATPAPVAESAPLTVDEIVGDPAARTGLGGLEALDDVRLVVCPDVMIGYDGSDDAKNRIKMVQEAMISHCERMKYRFAVLDTPPHLNIQQAKDWRMFLNFDSSYAALYYPWLGVRDMASPGSTIKYVPPSAHVAGIMSRVDEERGVHKAPANEVVKNAVGVEISVSKGEQDMLNPIGVNCIRAFPGRGLRIWGARTLSSNASWRYVNVRRLFIVVEASMDAGLQWVVFEPNDNTLWAKVRRDVTSFLRGVWRSGALFGTTPEQAFYVKCDEELNSPDVRDLGQLVIEVGMCPTKPAEFVIFRITQWAGLNAEA